MLKSVFFRLSLITVFSLTSGCQTLRDLQLQTPALETVYDFDMGLPDDMDFASLETAANESIKYYEKLKPSRIFRVGGRKVSVKALLASVKRIVTIFKQTKDAKERERIILREFNIYRGTGHYRLGNVLVTGYYQPVLNGSLTKNKTFKWPLYAKPPDLVTANLGDFYKSLKGKRITGRVKNGRLIPYHDRTAIDRKGVLADKGLEIVWVDDPVDVFFLQVQGSGVVRLSDGTEFYANYSAVNGRAYRSIGWFLIKNGAIPRKDMSLTAIRKWLNENPDELERVLDYNPSYVFFRRMNDGPFGSTGAKLVAGRSAAFDPRRFPKGALAHITVDTPVIENGEVIKWKKVERFVFSHDRGGAIKGTTRMDLFFGKGDNAGLRAGFMKNPGTLLFLVLKDRFVG